MPPINDMIAKSNHGVLLIYAYQSKRTTQGVCGTQSLIQADEDGRVTG